MMGTRVQSMTRHAALTLTADGTQAEEISQISAVISQGTCSMTECVVHEHKPCRFAEKAVAWRCMPAYRRQGTTPARHPHKQAEAALNCKLSESAKDNADLASGHPPCAAGWCRWTAAL